MLIKEAGAQDEITQWIEALISSKRLKTFLNYASLELEEETEYEKGKDYYKIVEPIQVLPYTIMEITYFSLFCFNGGYSIHSRY